MRSEPRDARAPEEEAAEGAALFVEEQRLVDVVLQLLLLPQETSDPFETSTLATSPARRVLGLPPRSQLSL